MSAAATQRRKRTRAALAALREAILAGRYSRDDMLPGERDLATHFAVSRTTLRRLVADLVGEGLLRHRQGVGTFIQREAASAPLPASDLPEGSSAARLPGFVEDMAARGVTVVTRDIARRLGLPTPEEAMLLACSPGEVVIRLLRLRLTGTQALAVEQATVPTRFVPSPEAIGASLYATLAARGFAPVRALQRLQAVAIGDTEAALLGVPSGSAGLCVRRTAYLAGGGCCECTRSTYPGPLYDTVSEILARPSV